MSPDTGISKNIKDTLTCCYLCMWGIRSAMISSLHNSTHAPKMEINPKETASGCPCGGVKSKNSDNKKTKQTNKNKTPPHPTHPRPQQQQQQQQQQQTNNNKQKQKHDHTRNPLILPIAGDPQSVRLGNATTTTTNGHVEGLPVKRKTGRGSR